MFLLDELGPRNGVVQLACEDLAYAVATRIIPGAPRGSHSWRLLTRLISHRFLLRRLGDDGARKVYSAIEDVMHWDYHFWLQRGSLELEEGSIRFAEQYLNQSYSLRPGDPFVITAYAYMLIRKAVCNAHSSDAEGFVEEGSRMLRGQIATRGKDDEYPFHVLGAQSLAWVSKSSWSKEKKVSFLKDVKKDVDSGLRHHRSSKDLQQLSADLQMKILATQVGLSG